MSTIVLVLLFLNSTSFYTRTNYTFICIYTLATGINTWSAVRPTLHQMGGPIPTRYVVNIYFFTVTLHLILFSAHWPAGTTVWHTDVQLQQSSLWNVRLLPRHWPINRSALNCHHLHPVYQTLFIHSVHVPKPDNIFLIYILMPSILNHECFVYILLITPRYLLINYPWFILSNSSVAQE